MKISQIEMVHKRAKTDKETKMATIKVLFNCQTVVNEEKMFQDGRFILPICNIRWQ